MTPPGTCTPTGCADTIRPLGHYTYCTTCHRLWRPGRKPSHRYWLPFTHMTRLTQLVWQTNDLDDTRLGTISLDERGFVPHPTHGGLTYAHSTFSGATRHLWTTTTANKHPTPPLRTEQ